jgi:hypothetical protein
MFAEMPLDNDTVINAGPLQPGGAAQASSERLEDVAQGRTI